MRGWRTILLVVAFAGAGCGSGASGVLDASLDDGGVHDTDLAHADEPLRCDHRDLHRIVLFGDLHVHTASSFDAYAFGTTLGPADAYDFARGKAVTIAGGATVAIQRPLDFAAVTDHSEFLGEISLCLDATQPAYTSEPCTTYRKWTAQHPAPGDDLFNRALTVFAGALIVPGPFRSTEICGDDGAACATAAATEWQRQNQITEARNDASSACTFTTLHAYEWSASPGNLHNHRNIIFRNAIVPSSPITYYDQQTPPDLWAALRARCIDAGTGCDALAIPHNSNLSGGLSFSLEMPVTAESARLRRNMEPLVEIYQNKGMSECKRGVGNDDPLCDLEYEDAAVCDGTNGAPPACMPLCPTGMLASHNCEAPLAYVRNALEEGLVQERAVGENPLQLGFIGSTDTHNATPGAVEEDTFRGHMGVWDGDPQDRLDQGLSRGAGGLAAVWAEENSRDAIFRALRRRETFATSGTRMQVRFFGGWSLPANLCARADLVDVGYAQGVPMGGDLAAAPDGAAAPSFAVWAMKDPGVTGHPSAPLQHVQIIKGWVDAGTGLPSEKVFEVAGDANNGASVDTTSCARSGTGADQLCAVWTDPEFRAADRAFYYVRVVENPSCRHTAYDCSMIAPADRPAYCSDDKNLILQERAWTSPIWYHSK